MATTREKIPEDVMEAAQAAFSSWQTISGPGGITVTIARAILAERERCAKVAESMPVLRAVSTAHVKSTTPKDVATAIRNHS